MDQPSHHSNSPSGQSGAPTNFLRSWYVLTTRRYPPLKYAIYSSLFVGAIQMSGPDTTLLVSFMQNLRLTIGTFLLLWFMRIVDEIKDLEHDREFHPERPLASAEVSVRHALQLLWVVALLIIVDASFQNWLMVALAVTIMLYSLLLWGTEQAWQWFEQCMTVNILFAVQLKTLLVFHVAAGLPLTTSHQVPIGVLAGAIACGYLHWEILRKTEHEPKNDKAYSNEIGTSASLTVSLLLLTLALSLMIFSLKPIAYSATLLSLAALPSLMGVLGFVRYRFAASRLSILSLVSYLLFLSILTWFHKIVGALQN